jgi:hypothetical protein
MVERRWSGGYFVLFFGLLLQTSLMISSSFVREGDAGEQVVRWFVGSSVGKACRLEMGPLGGKGEGVVCRSRSFPLSQVQVNATRKEKRA